VFRRESTFLALVDGQCFWAGKARVAEDQFQVRGLFDAALAAIAETVDDVALALANSFHVNGDGPGAHAIVGSAASQVGHAAASDHGLGGRAALVDACTAHVFAFDESRALSGLGQGTAQRRSALS